MAGGMGTRFRPLTKYIQKCMIPIGDKEKPILEYIIKLYKHHKIEDLVLLVGYRYLQIKNYFNSGERLDVKLSKRILVIQMLYFTCVFYKLIFYAQRNAT
mgnify:CR=1 FL=1